MKVQKINNLNFKATVNKDFITSAENYYVRRNLHLQLSTFEKFLEKFELYGSNKSELFHTVTRQGGERFYSLCLKNKELNPKKGIVVAAGNRFCEILKFAVKITDNQMLLWEDYLEKLK